MTSKLYTSLRQLFGDRVRLDEPLSRHTSFRIGGPADAWMEVESEDELWQLQKMSADEGVRLFVMGIGTNVLVSDRGVRGLVVKLGRSLGVLEWSEGERGMRAHAGAAAPFKKLVMDAANRGLTGLEFAEGIPGSIGGGLLMNAGAFGGEMSDVVDAVHGVEPAGGPRRYGREELSFGYRRFDLPSGLVITAVDFLLAPGDESAIRDQMADAKRRRDAKQPLGFPNAGSIFKNPPGEYAGILIEKVGLKGRRIGGAMVSEQHANFIVNVDRAMATDVKTLMDQIVDAVWQDRQVRLVPEIRLVGDWEAAS